MEADLKRIYAMEEDQEVTSRLRAEFMTGELPGSAIPNSVIPSNFRFLSYENMKKSVTCSPEAMQHPWVKGALAVTRKLPKENMDLKQQVFKCQEMVEHGLDSNHMMIAEFTNNHKPMPWKMDGKPTSSTTPTSPPPRA